MARGVRPAAPAPVAQHALDEDWAVSGTYQYKFIVDNEWRFATDQPTVRDEMGNINNCITVIDQAMYLHEHAASGFFGDTPHNMYTQVRQPLPLAASRPSRQPHASARSPPMSLPWPLLRREKKPNRPTHTRAAPRAC